MVVTQQHIQQGHIQTYLKVINSLEKKKQTAQSSLLILFEGYDKDSRKLYEVHEIKNWVQKLVNNKPHLFYFLVNITENYVHDMALCMVNQTNSFIPIELKKYMKTPELTLNGADVSPAIRKVTENAFIYGKKLKHTPEELMDLCMVILKNTLYEEHLDEIKQKL